MAFGQAPWLYKNAQKMERKTKAHKFATIGKAFILSMVDIHMLQDTHVYTAHIKFRYVNLNLEENVASGVFTVTQVVI